MPHKRFAPPLLENILLFDPGYTRLKAAVRGTLGLLLSFFLSSWIAQTVHGSTSLPFLGAMLAMMASVALVDLKKADETFAILFSTIPATVAVVISVALIPWPTARLVMFLVCTFAAVVVRRFGPKWTGVGLIAFMAYFASLFFPFHPSDIPWTILVMTSASGLTYLIRFGLFRDRPERTLRQLAEVFTLRERRMLVVILACLEAAKTTRLRLVGHELPTLWLPVRQSFIQLNELALALEQFLERSPSRSIRASSSAFQLELFEREFLLRRLWESAANLFRQYPDDENIRAAVVKDVRELLHHMMEKNSSLPPSQLPSTEPSHRDFIQARQNVADTLAQNLGQGVALETALATVAEPLRPGPAAAQPRTLHVSTRQAIQATLATALASAIGGMVSAQKWYWASISAFFVFIGASRGDTLIRATLRIVGTVLGLGLGFGLAFVLAEKSAGEWLLVVSSIFLAIYMSRVTFGFWSALLFSSMFALLYDRMGLMTRDVLLLRIEETGVGALMGVLVASMILPTSTHAVVREALVKYLRTMASIMNELRKNLPNAFSRRTLIRQLRELDRDLMNLRTMAAPIVGRGSLMKRGSIPGLLHDTTAMSHFLKHLALHVEPQTGREGFAEACQDLIAALLQQADRLAEGVSQRQLWTPGTGGLEPLDPAAQTGRLVQLDPAAQYYLKCLRLSLTSLANREV